MKFEKIKLVSGDITELAVDAIVNAANRTLLGGGGVDGAIHRAAGPDLHKECLTLGGCETGAAKITKGYRLPSKYVIHAVGPVWRGGSQNEEALLESAYRTSLQLAKQHDCKTVAFPNISTGVYGFPKEKAAEIAISTVQQFLDQNPIPERVYFVCFDNDNYGVYQSRLGL
jgi:O-acetyl-ADP-ribose deacetylase (regulator of RNase III)